MINISMDDNMTAITLDTLTPKPTVNRARTTMAPRSGLFNDEQVFHDFKGAARTQQVEGASAESLPMRILEWNKGDVEGRDDFLEDVSELRTRERARLRIIFAPLDWPHSSTAEGHIALLEHFKVPSSFGSERLQHVSQSFGTREEKDGVEYTWFHYLCKGVDVGKGKDGTRQIINPVTHVREVDQGREQLRQANHNWLKPGFVLISEPFWKPAGTLKRSVSRHSTSETLSEDPKPSEHAKGSPSSNSSSETVCDSDAKSTRPGASQTSRNESTETLSDTSKYVTLLCFGAPPPVFERFQRIAKTSGCDEALHDPHILLAVVLDELSKLFDRVAWQVGDIFGDIETKTLANASRPGRAGLTIDFVSLHNIAKHIIYLLEASECALSTISSLIAHHERLQSRDASSTIHTHQTHCSLLHRKTIFTSTRHHLTSLDRRMTNIIQLSFNLVTQTDSRTTQTEAKSMQTIAVMTLLFLPLQTIASIFGSQLFTLEGEGPRHLRVSADFYLLWIVSVPLTGVVVAVWRAWYRGARRELREGGYPWEGVDGGFLGWKRWRERLVGEAKDGRVV